ncbi:ImmA/IrrE family metallo-endopeptidase [Agrobacterium sp. B1(2019)]|uniref:ImmA/IrrE family metallo-endopeptidase n=1 Tax=Agrobacterium sp. B1(2019) TaxID=2607032 RepID=UPI0011EE988D|nr:ImmA/IrrE family metallo-endopeptidase [Agrobacterium sp. B1(2019)]TZG33474.1 ImmA/IrrE family metallo-endopeptidase [Agrobacterium sp. B1(2019)]
MNSSDKGDKLEDAFYQYLLDQKDRGELVLGAYPPDNCKIFKKKEYYCKEREADVEFDVVLEFYANGRTSPHLYVIFECKNYRGSVPELYVNDFSAKLGRMFPHTAKGVMVVSSRLQSGAEKVARNKGLGIVKYDGHGLDIIADRKARPYIENRFVEFQLFQGGSATKSLKFSAYNDGKFFSSISQFLGSLHPELAGDVGESPTAIPFMPPEAIKSSVREVLKLVDYRGGPVDLEHICSALSIDLQYSDQEVHDTDGTPILGSAHFHRKVISINSHGNRNRERFTLGHEIGHFFLKHQQYLSSENIIERDLLINKEMDASFNLERLEYQANSFSSNLILPDDFFKLKTAQFRNFLEIRDRGHGYIFVDDQPCNYTIYEQLLAALSTHFEVSKQVIQIKFKHLGMLNDQRKQNQASPVARVLEGLISPRSA